MATQGSYKIWTIDAAANLISTPGPEKKFPDPSSQEAVDFYFGIDSDAPQPPPKEQITLQDDIAKVLGTVQRLYKGAKPEPVKFRRYYTNLFRLAQLGLEPPTASPDIARGALTALISDLLDDEAAKVKNAHFLELGKYGLIFAIPFFVIFLAISLATDHVQPFLQAIGIAPSVMANFMLLWVGCFLGVWLSYGIRTAVVSLTDLTGTDSSRLLPQFRLLFAGALTMVLGLLFASGIVEIKLGGYVITKVAEIPTLAFLVGVLCGISELTLPAAVGKRATEFMGNVK